MHHGQLLRRGPRVDSAAPTVVTDAIAAIVRHLIVVNIVNNGGIHIRYRAVVVKPAVIPISAVIATAGVSKAIIDAAVVADMRTPVARVPMVVRRYRSPTRAASKAHPHKGPRSTHREPSNNRRSHSSSSQASKCNRRREREAGCNREEAAGVRKLGWAGRRKQL